MEGMGESSSPSGGLGLYDIKNDIYNKLVETGNDEAISSPDFKEQLDAHFNMLPTR